MSLINQMLKDLESRRTPDNPAHTLLQGSAAETRGGRSRQLLIMLSLLVALLALVLAYMVWERLSGPALSTPADNSAMAVKRPAESPPPPPVRGTPATSASASVAAEVASPATQAVPPATPTPQPQRPLHLPPLAPAQPAPVKQAEVATPPEAHEEHEPVTVVEKRIRPLRPDQLAEKAYKEGYQILQQGNQEGAEKKWRTALRHEPGHIASREGLAALYLSQGRNVEAGEALAGGLEHHPGHSQFALMYARIQVGNGQLGAALTTLERAQGAQTQGADFFAFLAALYQRQKSYDKSVAAYQRALSMQPRQGVWWMGIGISLEGEGKNLEATTAYNEAKKSGNLPPKLVQYVEGRLKRLEGM